MAAARHAPPCANAEQHTPHPRRQFAHEAWAEQMLRTHKQTRCPGCRLWAIWLPLPDAPDLPPIEYRIDHVACGCCDGQPHCDCEYHQHLARPDPPRHPKGHAVIDAPPPACAVCLRPSRDRVHPGCRDRIAAALRELPRLYRDLAGALQPGRRGGDGRTGTRNPPLPCNTEALDLRSRGGIEGVVGGWARDLCERERWDIPAYQSVQAVVDWSCRILLANLGVICDEHPAVGELAAELHQVAGQARRIITGETAPRKIGVVCGCGHVLRVTLDTPGTRCPDCGAQYGHTEALRLPLAERRAA